MEDKKNFFVRLRYNFDRTIAAGTASLLLWVTGITFIVVALASILISIGIVPTGEDAKSFGEAFWVALGVTLDPGTVSDPGWAYRILMLVVAILGILIVSVLIGILTSGIEEKLTELRRGRSTVIENNHTLILGWSSKSIPIIKELVIANENISDAVVVVLADMDKVEMEDIIAAEINNLKTTRIICRRGIPSDLTSLEIVSSNTARSFILLREEFEDADDDIIKAILALRKICGGTLSAPLVAEIVNPSNADAAVRIDRRVSIINASEVVVRIIAQTSREPGLSNIYEEILSFEGSEIYFRDEPGIEGMKFGDVCLSFENSIIIGIIDSQDNVTLNPQSDHLIGHGERVIAIAEDDDKIVYIANQTIPALLRDPQRNNESEQQPEKLLIIGWHHQGNILHREFKTLLPAGSEVHLIYDKNLVNFPPNFNTKGSTITWTISEGDTTHRKVLDKLKLREFDHVIVLSYRDVIDAKKADSKTLLTLIHLREILSQYPSCTIASELIDEKQRALAQGADISDFVASEALASKALVQISENFILNNVFKQLLTAKGSEFHLRDKELYGISDKETFFIISQIALQRGEIAIGYKNGAEVVINPIKSKPIEFSADSAIIVLAED